MSELLKTIQLLAELNLNSDPSVSCLMFLESLSLRGKRGHDDGFLGNSQEEQV